MPQTGPVLLSTVGSTVHHSISLVSVSFTPQQEILRGFLADLFRTKRSPAAKARCALGSSRIAFDGARSSESMDNYRPEARRWFAKGLKSQDRYHPKTDVH